MSSEKSHAFSFKIVRVITIVVSNPVKFLMNARLWRQSIASWYSMTSRFSAILLLSPPSYILCTMDVAVDSTLIYLVIKFQAILKNLILVIWAIYVKMNFLKFLQNTHNCHLNPFNLQYHVLAKKCPSKHQIPRERRDMMRKRSKLLKKIQKTLKIASNRLKSPNPSKCAKSNWKIHLKET